MLDLYSPIPAFESMIQSCTLESSITHPTHPTAFHIQNPASSDTNKSESIFAGTNWLLTHPKTGKMDVFLLSIWMFPWYPQIIHFDRVFHYKPSILGVKSPYFWFNIRIWEFSSLFKSHHLDPSEAPGSWVLSFCLLRDEADGENLGPASTLGKPSG